MKIFHDPKALQEALKDLRLSGNSIGFQGNLSVGFVPTMGALHAGHKSLIEHSIQQNQITVVSIFINPTQFLQGEDLDKYPKKLEADQKICELCGVDFLFIPNISAIYDKDEVLLKAPKYKGFILEGERRPGHFDGMLQVVLKLFNIVSPNNAYFGKKDAQQLALIEQMVKNLFLDINIIPCEIIRENSGLAMSSRNSYLEPKEIEKALHISKALKNGAKSIGSGELQVEKLKMQIKSHLLKNGVDEIEYIECLRRDFQQLEEIELKNSILLIAVKIGSTRLIDNLWV